MNPSIIVDPWQAVRRYTSARIALGRAGGSLPTRELLAFQQAHAAARDAVHLPFDAAKLAGRVGELGQATIILESSAGDRTVYLQRPDLGRKLCPESRQAVEKAEKGFDVALIVSDGLSALAAHDHAVSVLNALLPMLKQSGMSVSPVAIVKFGRVAIEDEIGGTLRAKVSVILLGERPGLGSADSLGAYLVFQPRIGLTDADRNCISNIRREGLPPSVAAGKIHFLIAEMIRRQISGVRLKDETGLLPENA